MKTEQIVSAFLHLLVTHELPVQFVVEANGKPLTITGRGVRVDSEGGTLPGWGKDPIVVFNVEVPSNAPAVSMLLLTYDAKKAVSYKDILRV